MKGNFTGEDFMTLIMIDKNTSATGIDCHFSIYFTSAKMPLQEVTTD